MAGEDDKDRGRGGDVNITAGHGGGDVHIAATSIRGGDGGSIVVPAKKRWFERPYGIIALNLLAAVIFAIAVYLFRGSF